MRLNLTRMLWVIGCRHGDPRDGIASVLGVLANHTYGYFDATGDQHDDTDPNDPATLQVLFFFLLLFPSLSLDPLRCTLCQCSGVRAQAPVA